MFPGQSKYVKNMYIDIAEYFCMVKNKMEELKGSYAYETIKPELIQIVDLIVFASSECAKTQPIPMNSFRPTSWVCTISEIDGNKLVDINKYTNKCIREVLFV